MDFGDDEPPPPISSSSSAGIKARQGERVRLVAYYNVEAPLVEHRQQVLLEVKGTSRSTAERSGLDLVAVLDVSRSMDADKKLDRMKTAMKFVISKLGPMDRLSIVSFSDEAKKWCSLQCMTRANKKKLIKDVIEDGLEADGWTNMEDGLVAGLKVLSGRRYVAGRVGSIILMSDGEQNRGGEAQNVEDIPNAAVYTFGFGAESDAKVLEEIASKSQGGTFYFVKDGASLNEHFSQLLAGLLSVVVQDLNLTVWEVPGQSNIDEVDAGGYDPTTKRDSSVTVSFGDLYNGEERKVIVNLHLPAIRREYHRERTLLFAQCVYSIQGKYTYSPRDHLRCDMRRIRTAPPPDAVKPEVKAELIRRRYTTTLQEVSELGDGDIVSAKRKLEEAKTDLDAEQQQQHPSSVTSTMINNIRKELLFLLSLTVWKEFISFLLASWTSHSRQRFAGGSSTFFVTPRMRAYKDQAQEFDKNPRIEVPSVEDDAKKEMMARERRRPAVTAGNHLRRRRAWEESPERTRRWAWRAVIVLCTVLAIAVIVAGAVVFSVFLLYKPRMPALVVSGARLRDLQYGQDGAIAYLQASITILAENNNSKADASFSSVDLALGFHGADVALLRADPFVVARRSALPLRYNVQSAGLALDPAGMQAMDEALRAGVVPLDLFGKARTRWKVGVFVNLKFWTRINCRLRFFFPGNGTVMATDSQKCLSRSP